MINKIKPIIIKEFREIKRDPLTLSILIIIPAFMLIMFGYALNFDIKNIKIAIYDMDKSKISRNFIGDFINSGYFECCNILKSFEEIDELLQRGEVLAVVVISESFSKEISKGKTAKIQILIDGTNSNNATTILGYVNAVVSNFSKNIMINKIKKIGGKGINDPIDYKPRILFNPDLKSVRFLILGLISLILLMSSVISTSLSIVREKEKNTIEQILVSPIKIYQLILGKIVNYIVIAFLSTVLIFLAGYFLFDIKIRGNYFMLTLAISIYLALSLAIGILISSISKSQQTAFMISSMITILPTFILSGFVFPIRNMPKVIQLITYIIPARYFLTILRGIVLKGATITSYLSNFITMTIMMFIFIGLCIIVTKRIKI